MKKIIITAISAFAVIASVIGCQIYDSQTNANLYHNGVKLQDFTADFNKSCKALKDNSSDENAYSEVVDAFISFTEYFWEKTAVGTVKTVVAKERDKEMSEWNKQQKKITGKKYETTDAPYVTKKAELTVRDNNKIRDLEWCKDKYKSSCLSQVSLYQALYNYAVKCYKEDASLKDATAAKKAAAKQKFIEEFSDYEDFVYDWNDAADGGEWSLAALWEKTYKLIWDYNSKK